MLIVETSIFTRQVQVLLTAEEYRRLQIALVLRPDTGSIIPGSGGLRKTRWSAQSRGKRSGVRVIYYWAARQDRILMLAIYAKSQRDDLTAEQLKTLTRIVEEEFP
ncbi:MAG: hypothetical protein JXB15_09435 [Anaerolineales bacterium]|nr:hypothetical protein [Anaerolineales bacterium]